MASMLFFIFPFCLLCQYVADNPTISTFCYNLKAAIGCPRLPEPVNGWIQQDHTTAIIGCHEKQKSWRLHCNGTKWNGEYGNCSESIADSVTGNQEEHVVASMSFEISVMVVIVLAITIGLMVLALGLYCMKKQRPRRGNSTASYDDSSDENIRDIHLVKPVPQEQISFQPHAVVMTQKGTAFKENEYASMRLLSNFPDVMYDRDNLVNQARDPRCPAHMYEASQHPKHILQGVDTYSASESGIHADYVPHCFDMDPETAAYKCHTKDCVISSTLPGRGSKTKCHLVGVRGSRGSSGEFKFTLADYGTGRKASTMTTFPSDTQESQVVTNTTPGKCST